jgi:Aspartyl protease
MKKRILSFLGIVGAISLFLALLPSAARAHCSAATHTTVALRSISDSSSASIDIQLAGGLIYMQGSLNGSEPLWMMLDTGSSVTVFDESVSRSLGLGLRGEGNAYGPGEGSPQKLAFASHARLRFAGAELGDQTVATLPLDWFSREVGRSTDGFLGSNLFRKFVVEIDYANQVLRLYDPAVYSYSGSGQRLPLEFTGDNIPRVRAEVITPDGKSITGVFLVDTGSMTGLWLTKAFSDAHPELLSAEKTTEAASGVAVGGEIRFRIGRVPAIRLGEFVVQEPITKFSQNTSGLFAGRHLAGIIGAQVLWQFTVIFDYPHRQMILQPNTRFGDRRHEEEIAKSLTVGQHSSE